MARTIDLGLVGNQPEIEGTARTGRHRSPAGPRRRAWAAGRSWHWWPAALVAAAFLATAGATSPAASSSDSLAPLYTVPAGDEVVLADGHLYVMATEGTVTAYRLADGAEQWQRRAAELVPDPMARPPSFVVMAGVPLVSLFTVPDPAGAPEVRPALRVPTTVALDPVTGDVRWTHQGTPRGTADGRILLDDAYLRPGYGEDDHLAAVEPCSGTQRWRMELTGPMLASVDDKRLVTLAPDGMLTAHDLATGEVSARASLPAQPDGLQLVLVGPVVLLQTDERGQLEVHAYDIDDLAFRWTAQVDGPVWPCGDLICVTGPDEWYALDPATGRPAWSPRTPDPRLRNWTAADLPGGRHLLLARKAVGGATWIVDLRTGDSVRMLTGWGLVGDADAYLPGQLQSQQWPLLYRISAEGTWLGRIDPGSLGIDVLGFAGDIVPAFCTPSAGHLACRDPDDLETLRVFRIAHG